MSGVSRRIKKLVDELWRVSLPLLDVEQQRDAFLAGEQMRAGEVTWQESEQVARAVLRYGWRRASLKASLGDYGQPVASMSDEELDEVEARLAKLDDWRTTEEERSAAIDWLLDRLVENGQK